MTEKTFNTRIIHKHDIELNWLKTPDFIPMSGELIIYDVDENNKYARMKIGDGVTKISDLPFTKEIALDANNIIKQENLPEGYPYLSYGKVLPKTTIQIEQGYGVINEKVLAGSGLTYQINYNGEFYECTGANKKVDGIEVVFLGNSAYVGEEDTGEPFALLILKGKDVDTYGFGAMVAVNDENITAIELSIEGAIVQTIDPVYLPSIELGLQNLIDGKALGSMRAIGTREEDADYSLGSHATSFGNHTWASGDYSFSEGSLSHALGKGSHAEGYSCVAHDDYSHAEGYIVRAYGKGTHCEGMGTMIASDGAHAQGRYNIRGTDELVYAHVVGNGTVTNRSNAHTLDWAGNAWYQGDIYVGSTSGINKDEGSKKLATEEFVSNILVETELITPEDIDIICGVIMQGGK